MDSYEMRYAYLRASGAEIDIVERLRYGYHASCLSVFKDAADEIERLQAKVRDLQKTENN